jgi:uncharacterized protein with FMN-binding domain
MSLNTNARHAITLVSVLGILSMVGFLVYTRFNTYSFTSREEKEIIPVAFTPAQVRGDGKYPDGVYTTLGTYAPHGMDTQIEVTVTLKNDRIAASDVLLLSKNPTSVRITKKFTENYQQFVLGMPIQGLDLDAIAGSSLTPKGYNAALRQIEAYATTLE